MNTSTPNQNFTFIRQINFVNDQTSFAQASNFQEISSNMKELFKNNIDLLHVHARAIRQGFGARESLGAAAVEPD